MLKRHPVMQDLSRDHLRFLMEARHIRWLLDEDERSASLHEVIHALLIFWKEHGSLHLREEEEVLIPFVLERRPLARQMLHRLEIDHEWLREKFTELDAMPHYENCVPLLRSMADYITSHVRLEEREVFPAIQEWLDETALQQLGERSRAFRMEHRGPASIGPAGPSHDLDESGMDADLES